MKVISVKLPAELERELAAQAKRKGLSRSDVVREALVQSFTTPRRRARSLVARAPDLVGCVSGGPRDLSTNPAYLDDLGR